MIGGLLLMALGGVLIIGAFAAGALLDARGGRVAVVCALGIAVLILGIAVLIKDSEQRCADKGGHIHSLARGSLCLTNDGRVIE